MSFDSTENSEEPRIWSGDNKDLFPMGVSTNFGGTMEVAAEPWRTFQVMSNELGATLILKCLTDPRREALSFDSLANSNISYFIGLEANETSPTMVLAGDRNVTNGRPVLDGVLSVSTNDHIGWTHEIHRSAGNIALSDGSVQQATSGKLQDSVRNCGATNGTFRLAMPE